MIKNEDLLPIGTVVLLQGGTKRIMIYGIKQLVQEGDNTIKMYDYCGVFYPEGNTDKDSHILFNHTDIKAVFYRGYEDDSRSEFIKLLDLSDETMDKALIEKIKE